LYLLDLLVRKQPSLAARMFEAGALAHCGSLAPAFPDAVLLLAHAIAIVLARAGAVGRVAEEIRSLGIIEACGDAADLEPEQANEVDARARALLAVLENGMPD
jgi:hypothetical protein